MFTVVENIIDGCREYFSPGNPIGVMQNEVIVARVATVAEAMALVDEGTQTPR